MKHPTQTPHRNLFNQVAKLKPYKTFSLALSLAALPFVSHADGNWTGSAADNNWDNLANWSANPSGGAAFVNTNNNSRPIVTSANTVVIPNDIKIGASPGTTGRVDVVSGTLNYVYWSFIGDWDGNGTLNIADTSTSGGAFTGYGLGSGSYVSANAAGNANLQVGLYQSTGVINMNTSGTLDTQNLNISPNGQAGSGTLNLDNGTVNVSSEVQVGSSFWGNGTTSLGYLNMSGGTVTANIVSVSRGNNNGANIQGFINLTGGTLNTKQWFTLGFAGSAAAFAGVTNNGGTINVNTTGGGSMEMTTYDPISAYFKQSSGALNLCNGAGILFGSGGNNSGTVTFDHNGGPVTFYSDVATTVGGAGYLSLGQGGDSGTYAYNLNGGTLTVPSITRTASSGSGTFNFNGGTLKPAATTATFMSGLTTANVQSGGANIDTDGYDITIGQALSGTGTVTKLGAGTLTLTGTSTHTGIMVINNGLLALSGTGTLASTVVIPAGKIFDVSSLTVGIQNPVTGVGAVSGSATAAAGMAIYPATDGTVGTLTFNNDLNMSAGGSIRLDLSTTYNSGNDQVAVTGNLTVSSATIVRIKALSGAANLSTVGDYVLCTAGGTLTMSSTPSLAWDGTVPANYLNYSVAQVGNTLVLKYTSSTAPTVAATASRTNLVRNQSFLLTATVTPGTGSVTNVVTDASLIGGSSSASLVLSATANVYTNTFVVSSSIAPGAKTLTIVAQANSGLNSPGYSVNVNVLATNETWTGASANDFWSTSANWNNAAPAASGDAVTFAGSTRLAPDMDANYSVTGVTFASGAGSFILGSTGGNTLTLTGNGVLNLSANPQTLNTPVAMSAAQTFNADAGNLIISNSLAKGGNLLTVTGAANTVISGPISGSGSLFKKGSGILTVTTNGTWDLSQASSGGFGGPLLAQAGTVKFTGGSVQTVTGELVVGGVIANGGAGNDAKIIVDGATLNVSSWLSIGRGNGVGGVSSDLILTNGAIVTAPNSSAGFNAGNGANKPKGSISLYDTSSLTINSDFHIAEAGGGNIAVNVNGASTLTYGNFMDLAIGFGGTVANLNVNGGTVNCGGDAFIGHWGDGNAALTINSGSVNFATAGERWLFMGYWDYVNGTININGGALNFWNNSKVRMARNDNNGGNTFAHVINHNSGTVTFFSDGGATPGGSGLLDMQYSGGASGTSTYNLNGGTLNVPAINSSQTSGRRIFNFNGGTLTAGAVGTLMDLGLGNAHAYVRTGGAIIDDNGNSVTIATALEHFSGDATDGGLVKKGSSTLNLTGANTYTGNTVIQAGTLELLQATLASFSTVNISNSAVLQLDFSTTNQVYGLVLNGVAQAAGVYNNASTPTYLTGAGSLLVQPIAGNPTNITFSVSGNTLSLSWPSDHLGWILQSNSVGLVATGSWFNYPANGSVDVTTVNITINPNQPNVFFRMVKP